MRMFSRGYIVTVTSHECTTQSLRWSREEGGRERAGGAVASRLKRTLPDSSRPSPLAASTRSDS